MIKTPDPIPQKDLIDQTHALQKQKEHLELVLEQTEHRLKSIEASLAENEHLKEQVKKLMQESAHLFEEENNRKVTHFADIHYKVLVAALEQIASSAG